MRYKTGVNLEGVQPCMWYALGTADMVYRAHGQKLVVTSLTDGVHPDLKNIHGNGLAADLRTNGIVEDTVTAVYNHLKLLLDPLGYDVVREGDHIHLEYDPKQSETWKEEVA
jgi:hypothetical protein